MSQVIGNRCVVTRKPATPGFAGRLRDQGRGAALFGLKGRVVLVVGTAGNHNERIGLRASFEP